MIETFLTKVVCYKKERYKSTISTIPVSIIFEDKKEVIYHSKISTEIITLPIKTFLFRKFYKNALIMEYICIYENENLEEAMKLSFILIKDHFKRHCFLKKSYFDCLKTIEEKIF